VLYFALKSFLIKSVFNQLFVILELHLIMSKPFFTLILLIICLTSFSQKEGAKKLITEAEEIETHFTEDHSTAQQKLNIASQLILEQNLTDLNPYFYFVYAKLKSNLLQKDSAAYYYQLSLSAAIAAKDKLFETRALSGLGNLQFQKGNYDEAIKLYYQSLKIAEQNNFKDKMAACNKNIGFCHLRIRQFPKALSYYNTALQLFESLKDSNNISQTIINIGSVYYELNDSKNALKKFNQSLEISLALNDSVSISKLYNNIGAIYIDSEKDTLKGLAYLLKALKLKEILEDNETLSFTYDNIGNVYSQLKKFDSASFFLKKALAFATKSNSPYDLKDVYESYANLYSAQNDYKNALYYYRLSAQMKDSVINTESLEQIAEIETKFEVEKKDLQLAKNKAELEAQQKQQVIKNIIITAILIIALLLLFLIYSYFANIKKQQQLKFQADLELQKQKNERSIFEAEEKERTRIAQDLHDNMGAYATSILAQIDTVELSPNEIKTEKIKDLRSDAENIMATLRETIWILKTKTISVHQFFDLLKIYADKHLAKNLNIQLTFIENVSTLKYLTPSTSLNLYRIIQEMIQNIIKHSKAKQVEFTLFSNEKIVLQIVDDGIGFNTDNLSRKSGLENMESRASEINYHIDTQSKPNKGTQIRVEEK
jgi:signal transduction histidine kinase